VEQFGAPGREFVHVGSIDIDLVVDPDLVDAERYATIVDLLLDRGYEPGADPLFQFQRTIRSPRDGQDYVIGLDFLTPRPLPGQGRSHRHRQVQRDLRARTLEGAEVALAFQEAKVHQARALEAQGLAAAGAVEREEAGLPKETSRGE
jgi:hypothetical protein